MNLINRPNLVLFYVVVLSAAFGWIHQNSDALSLVNYILIMVPVVFIAALLQAHRKFRVWRFFVWFAWDSFMAALTYYVFYGWFLS